MSLYFFSYTKFFPNEMIQLTSYSAYLSLMVSNSHLSQSKKFKQRLFNCKIRNKLACFGEQKLFLFIKSHQLNANLPFSLFRCSQHRQLVLNPRSQEEEASALPMCYCCQLILPLFKLALRGKNCSFILDLDGSIVTVFLKPLTIILRSF